MADASGTPARPGGIPAIDPVAAGALHDADVAAIVAALNGPNPCWADMNLPPALTDDGAM